MDFLDLCKSMNIVSTLPEYVKPKKCRSNVFLIWSRTVSLLLVISARTSLSVRKGCGNTGHTAGGTEIAGLMSSWKKCTWQKNAIPDSAKIRNALRYNGSPEPLFETDDVPISQRQFIFIRILRLQRQIKMQMKVYLIVWIKMKQQF